MKLSPKLVKWARILLAVLGSFAIVSTLLPIIGTEHWSVRSFDYPLLQLAVFTLALLLFCIPFYDLGEIWDRVLVLLLLACFAFQVFKIFPYTTLGKIEVLDATNNFDPTFSIYTANVQQKNDNMQGLLADTRSFEADVLLFTETNKKWKSFLDNELVADYPYKVQVPKNNTYGMLLYSKFELAEASVQYLVEDSIPSIHTKMFLPFKNMIQIYAIHPSPPTPLHNPKSLDRDAELIKVGRLAKNSKIPVVVMGDFNDVAWSETTQLFQKYSGLLDLRKGRGLFNTYNAKYWFVRWPLDHVFVSPHFGMVDIELGGAVGSDHFPFYTELSLEPYLAPLQELPKPRSETLEKANEQIKEERLDDRVRQN
ncbi:MAG: endonuclease/exonuclease/phosphatase family protein [Maribacter sp.]